MRLCFGANATILSLCVAFAITNQELCDTIVPSGALNGPRPLRLPRRFVMLANNLAKDIIHDFFLSSAITANAMRKLGAEGGCNRRFICVQLPELTDGKSEAYKAGYKSICKIGKERIHRAGVKIKKTSPLATNTVNTGFRVLRLDSSNRKIWDDSPLTNQNASTLFERRMLEYLGVLVRGRYEIEMTYDVVLKSG